MGTRRKGPEPGLTPEVQDRIIQAVRAGAPLHFAAGIAGVRRETVWNWVRKGERGIKPYAEFAAEFEKARSTAVVRNMAHIQTAAQGNADRPGDWRAAAWFLERSFPGEFARKDKLEVSGDEDNPVRVAGPADDRSRAQVNAVSMLVDEDRAGAVLAALVEAGVFPEQAMAGVEFVEDPAEAVDEKPAGNV